MRRVLAENGLSRTPEQEAAEERRFQELHRAYEAARQRPNDGECVNGSTVSSVDRHVSLDFAGLYPDVGRYAEIRDTLRPAGYGRHVNARQGERIVETDVPFRNASDFYALERREAGPVLVDSLPERNDAPLPPVLFAVADALDELSDDDELPELVESTLFPETMSFEGAAVLDTRPVTVESSSDVVLPSFFRYPSRRNLHQYNADLEDVPMEEVD